MRMITLQKGESEGRRERGDEEKDERRVGEGIKDSHTVVYQDKLKPHKHDTIVISSKTKKLLNNP